MKVEDRLAYWFLTLNNPNNEISILFSQDVLADILHTSRGSLNQEIKKLEE